MSVAWPYLGQEGVIARAPLPAWIMAVLVCVETTFLIATGRLAGPLWFELAAATSLVAAIVAGGWVWRSRRGLASGGPAHRAG